MPRYLDQLPQDLPALLVLVLVGAIAAGINSVAGGGSLISYPILVGMGIPKIIANATNSVALWPGSLAGAIGFLNQLAKTKRYLKLLLWPTVLGSALGAWLLVLSTERIFAILVPILILFASMLLAGQRHIRAWCAKHQREMGPVGAVLIQFLVAVYGGYFGAGMGIMMLAAFVLYMDGTIHELNAVKNWLGLVINFAASVLFLAQGLVSPAPAAALMVGCIIGGYASSKISQRVNPDKLRVAIAGYGFLMAAYFAWNAFASS